MPAPRLATLLASLALLTAACGAPRGAKSPADPDPSAPAGRAEAPARPSPGAEGAGPSVAEPPPADPPARRPNVLLLMADQLRGDALGCEGRAPVRTPHLDRLAAEGARFEKAYSSVPSCTPARAALLTGRSPWGHGMLGYSRIAERYPVELPRLFTEAGYRTHAIGKNHFHPQRNTHGYETVELDESGRVESEDFESDYRRWFRETAPELDPDATGIGWNDYRAAPYALPEELHPTTWTADRAVEFLASVEEDRPFLLKVSFARPHSPYDPPARWLEAYADVEPAPPARGDWSDAAHGDVHRPEAFRAARNHLDPEVVRAARRAYYASVSFVDEAIGRVLDALEATGRAEDTLVVFLSDHGDMLGDHHLWRKTYAYEGSARIPLVVRWGSRVLDAPRGQVRSELAEIRDVLPTLLDGCGLPVPAGVEGASLLSLVSGEADGWREVLDLEHATCYWPGNVWTALTDGRQKYVFSAFDGSEQLFDLARDPEESVDLARDPAHAGELAAWRGRMARHLAERGDAWSTGERPRRRIETVLHGPSYPR